MSLILSGTDGLSDVDGSAATPAIRGTDANTGIFFPAADTIAFAEGGAEVARFDSSGNFGLGVTPSAWGSIFKAVQVGSLTAIRGSTATAGFSFNSYYDGSAFKYISTGVATDYYQNNGQHYWQYAASGTAGNAITFTQAMTLDASGRLGIGQTSPQYPLHITGASGVATYAHFTNATTGNTASDGFSIGVPNGASDAYIIQRESANLFFYTNALERAAIDASGNLLVGTTSQLGGGKVGMVQTTGSQVLVLRNTNASTPYGLVAEYTGAAPNSVSSQFIYCNDTGGLRMEVRSNGGIANYSANNVNLSDRREKTNFAPAGSYLDKICAIPVQTFNYIDQNLEDDGGLTLGVVAQDVQAVAPEMVMESNWGTEEEPKMRLSIYQTDLQYALMKCIQEQQALITTLTDRITALENK